MKLPLRVFASLLISLGVLAGCLPGAEARFREKLVRLLDEDLEAICGEIQVKDASALLDRPFYRIVEYKATPNSGSYSHLCAVDYYYLKTIKMKQIRKYRYNPTTGEWERYLKQIVTILRGNRKP